MLFIFVLCNWFCFSEVLGDEATTSTPMFLDHPRISRLGNIVSLSSKNCTGSGDGPEGTLACRQSYSNGDWLVLASDYETFGHELQVQTRISLRDHLGQEKEGKTIRHKIRYVTLGRQKMKEAEFFDIVRRSPLGKVTHEIFLYEYHLESQEIKTARWALYHRVGRSSLVSLSHHAYLANDADGKPLSAEVDRYHDGVKVEELYQWDRIRDGSTRFDPLAWTQWKEKVFKPLRG